MVDYVMDNVAHFAVADVLDGQGGSSITARLVGRHTLPQLLVGPVVGRVTCNSAVALFEIDADARVQIALTDVFNNERRVVDVAATACTPFVVCFDELLDERRYGHRHCPCPNTLLPLHVADCLGVCVRVSMWAGTR